MNTTATRFYELLLTSVKHDIEQKTGEPIELSDIQSGYVYEKLLTNKMGSQGAAKTTLTHIEPPHLYEAAFDTARGTNTVTYQITELAAQLIEVTYREKYEPINRVAGLNHRIMSFFYNRSNRKRMLQLLQQMKAHLQG